jgi:hypothetical protein
LEEGDHSVTGKTISNHRLIVAVRIAEGHIAMRGLLRCIEGAEKRLSHVANKERSSEASHWYL